MFLGETNVKSFKHADRTVVKFYDDGSGANEVSCPFCKWQGCSEVARLPSSQGHSTLRCPECLTVLGAMIGQRVKHPVMAQWGED